MSLRIKEIFVKCAATNSSKSSYRVCPQPSPSLLESSIVILFCFISTMACWIAVHLSSQVYKWVQLNLVLGVTLRWTGIPSRGE